MIDFNIQYFGGRGAGSDGPSLSGGGGGRVDIQEQTDVWSYRHNSKNEEFVDAINNGMKTLDDDFPGLMRNTVTSVNAGKFGGSDAYGTLGVYSEGDRSITINQRYTDVGRMNAIYDKAGDYHPSRGNKSAVEAVALHEGGHALTEHVAKKMGTNFEDASKKIVNDAYKASGGKGGTKAWAGKISRYAQQNYAECIAEGVADYYCNGKAAKQASKAIVSQLKKYN